MHFRVICSSNSKVSLGAKKFIFCVSIAETLVMHMFVVAVFLLPCVTAHSEVIDRARAICEASCRITYPGFRLIHCHEVSLV